jgi:hypothetical protein
VAAQLLVAWSHPGRVRSEAAFARLAGVAPLPASSGQTTRHRLSRGGDRQLNHVIHTVVLHRRQHDPATKDYIAKRIAEGKSHRDATRLLKRYLARSLSRLLQNQEPLMACQVRGASFPSTGLSESSPPQYRVAFTPDLALTTARSSRPARSTKSLAPMPRGEEVDEQLVDAFSLIVMHPERSVGQALHAVEAGQVVAVGLGEVGAEVGIALPPDDQR